MTKQYGDSWLDRAARNGRAAASVPAPELSITGGTAPRATHSRPPTPAGAQHVRSPEPGPRSPAPRAGVFADTHPTALALGYRLPMGVEPPHGFGGFLPQPTYATRGYTANGPTFGPSYGSGRGPAPAPAAFAGWGRRVSAMLIDNIPSYVGLVIFYVGYGIWAVGMATSGSAPPDLLRGVVPMIIGMAVIVLGLCWTIYNRWITAGRTGQSLGKRVMKIRLVSELTGAPIGAANAFIRDLVHILDGAAYVGYLWPLWDDKRQTFADKIVKTVVVPVEPAPPTS